MYYYNIGVLFGEMIDGSYDYIILSSENLYSQKDFIKMINKVKQSFKRSSHCDYESIAIGLCMKYSFNIISKRMFQIINTGNTIPKIEASYLFKPKNNDKQILLRMSNRFIYGALGLEDFDNALHETKFGSFI